MSIPPPAMLRAWREREFAQGKRSWSERLALKVWAFVAKRPLMRLAGGCGRFTWLPFGTSWTRVRDLPAPEGRTFQQLYAKAQRRDRQ